MKVLSVANYIKHLAKVYGDDELTSMKLQKLLYYSYSFFLVFKDEKLFPESIEKWSLGPVVPEIWQLTNKESWLSIPPGDISDVTCDQKKIIGDVFKVYGRYAAWTLSNMTHAESPWINSHLNSVISDESIKEWFTRQKENFIFEVECIEDLEDIQIIKNDSAHGSDIDWEDLKRKLNAESA